MIAHLQGGAYGGVRILSDDTIRRMHARQFAPLDSRLIHHLRQAVVTLHLSLIYTSPPMRSVTGATPERH
jgi:hypothetical protein